jgi:hypothetical protein
MNFITRAFAALVDWMEPAARINAAADDLLGYRDPPSDQYPKGTCPGNKSKCQWKKHNSNTAKRTCQKCGAEDWVFWDRYPGIGDPTYFWRRMHDPNEKKQRLAEDE